MSPLSFPYFSLILGAPGAEEHQGHGQGEVVPLYSWEVLNWIIIVIYLGFISRVAVLYPLGSAGF